MADLFDYQTQTLCHKSDPDTSHEAAQKMIESGKLNKQEDEVYQAILTEYKYRKSNPYFPFTFTAKELPGLNYFTVQRRLSGLERNLKIKRIIKGYKPDGKPIYKKRDSCCVWRLL